MRLADVERQHFPSLDSASLKNRFVDCSPRLSPEVIGRVLHERPRRLETKYFYDTVGNVVQVTDPLNHSTTTAYSPAYHYAYPTAVTNAKGQTVQTSYNFNTSLVTSVTDANNQTTSFQYETYNRLSRVDRPNGGWETREYVDNYFIGPLRTYVRTRKSVDSGGGVSEEVSYQDGLGRLLKTKIVEGSEVASYVDREYAACSCTGKTAKVSMPYRDGNPVWTQTQYDGLGRIRKVIPPDGSSASNYTEYRYKVARVTASYGNGCVSENQRTNPTRLFVGVFDAKGIGRVQVYDVDGRLREVREDAAADFSSSYVTQYQPEIDTTYFYKPGDPNTPYIRYSLPTIVQGAQSRWQRVDSLGRVTQDQQVESGLTSLTYDDAGRALTKTDSRGIVTTTYYDEINRPTSLTFSDGTPGITYVYDTGSYGIGRLASVGNSVATSAYTYNNVGQVTREDKTINGVPFYATYGYNLAGQVTTARLPNGTTLTNTYDGIGRLASLTSDWVDGNHPATLASGFVYNAAQAVAQVDFGNGTRMTRTFNSGLQLKTLKHGTPGVPGSLLDLEYNYQETVSNNGRIMGITNYNDRTKDLSYTYDDLYRLATAETAGSHWGLSWTYDRYGNRLTQSVTKGTAPASSLSYVNATNRVNSWTYDNAGNATNDGRHTYTWNALNQQTTMDGTAAQYRYDAQGNRVLKITPTKTTYYVLGSGEYSGGVWEKLYVSLGGQKLVEYSNGTTYFFHCDHLGTPRVQTNISGGVVETWDAYPFGEQWTMTGGVGNKHHYTGKERDTESANDYFGARYYFAGNARWLSVDPGRRPGDPQQLNLYAYVRNDPVNWVDRDGRLLEDPEGLSRPKGPELHWWYFLTSDGESWFVHNIVWWTRGAGGGSSGAGGFDDVPGAEFLRLKLKAFHESIKHFATEPDNCESMAQIFEQAAAQFGRSTFLNAIADSLTEHGDWFGGDPDYVQFNDKGFADKYKESGPDDGNPYYNNQVRHFAAGFVLGALSAIAVGGNPLAQKIFDMREKEGLPGDGDRNLNEVSFELGKNFTRFAIDPSALGSQIRERVCAK